MIPALILDLIRFLSDKIFGISLEKKIEKEPHNVKLLMKIAIRALKKNDYKKALSFFIRLYELNPNNKVAIFYNGLLNLRLKNFGKSQEFFYTYVQDPISHPKGDVEKEIYYLLPEAYYYLGYSYYMVNDLENAQKYKHLAISKESRLAKLTMY